MKKYKQTSEASLNIANDGRRTLVEVMTDNRGDTRITFGASYTLRVDVQDLELLIESMQNAFEGHKAQAIAEVQAKTQESLPFNEEADVNWPLNDPRKW